MDPHPALRASLSQRAREQYSALKARYTEYHLISSGGKYVPFLLFP